MATGDIWAQKGSTNDTTNVTKRGNRLTVGGYGEATFKHNFFSDNAFRYSYANRYAQSSGHSQVDLPHVVLMLGYDFGQGWSMGSEIEFEHGGLEAALEIEQEETGEFEQEIERGGEVALEQFWLQKSWHRALNLRMGHIVVPVGGTNSSHLPTEFCNVFRPEGENTIMPCTWHETGISLWGRGEQWRYELQLIPSLNSTMFNVSGLAHDASPSGYEFRVANKLALAARIDNYTFPGLRMSLSGFVGNTFNNDIVTEEGSTTYANVKGTMLLGAFDFLYHRGRWVARGNVDYGYLSDAALISRYNGYLPNSNTAPYPHTLVGQTACAAGLELACNILSPDNSKQLLLFARYDYYDSYNPASVVSGGQTVPLSDFPWTERSLTSAGFNYYPLPQIVIKGEVGYRMLPKQYNNEPWVALGVAYSAFFRQY